MLNLNHLLALQAHQSIAGEPSQPCTTAGNDTSSITDYLGYFSNTVELKCCHNFHPSIFYTCFCHHSESRGVAAAWEGYVLRRLPVHCKATLKGKQLSTLTHTDNSEFPIHPAPRINNIIFSEKKQNFLSYSLLVLYTLLSSQYAWTLPLKVACVLHSSGLCYCCLLWSPNCLSIL